MNMFLMRRCASSSLMICSVIVSILLFEFVS
jgi:hypothetical protein